MSDILRVKRRHEFVFLYRNAIASVWIPNENAVDIRCQYSEPDFAAIVRTLDGREVLIPPDQWEQTKTFLGITE